MGTELPGFHPCGVFFTADRHQLIEKPFSLGRRRGAGEARAHARAGVGGQGELADQQQTAAGIPQGAVHLAGIVGENTITQQPVSHPRQHRRFVARLHPHQRQQAGADLPHHRVINRDRGLGNTLDQAKHG